MTQARRRGALTWGRGRQPRPTLSRLTSAALLRRGDSTRESPGLPGSPPVVGAGTRNNNVLHFQSQISVIEILDGSLRNNTTNDVPPKYQTICPFLVYQYSQIGATMTTLGLQCWDIFIGPKRSLYILAITTP